MEKNWDMLWADTLGQSIAAAPDDKRPLDILSSELLCV
jgi:hypothetical protein